MDKERRSRTYEAVERATERPMLVLALVMIPLIVVPFAFDLTASADWALIGANWFIWAVFALELVLKTYLAPSRRHYLVTHWFDVLIVVIPVLRPLRVARSLRALRALQSLRLAAVLTRSLFSGRSVMARHGLQYLLLGALIVVFVVAGIVTVLEEGANGRSISDFPTALWWAATTVTTVGYGDTAPVTAEGRGIGVFLMLVGIGIFSVITANVAAFFVESDKTDAGNADVAEELRRLQDRIAELQVTLERS